jgi:hypothetical protein
MEVDFVSKPMMAQVDKDLERIVGVYQEKMNNRALALLGGTLLMSALESLERTGETEQAEAVRQYVQKFLDGVSGIGENVILN